MNFKMHHKSNQINRRINMNGEIAPNSTEIQANLDKNLEYGLELDDRDIADVMIENHFNTSRDIADVMIEQPQPIVVGLTDDQLIDLIKALSISSTDEQFNARLDFAREWLKAQTFYNDKNPCYCFD